ncbi:Crp/Fnr family transcriptional regulator [Ilyomonas limi]|uniref:Crp/Fnr family transcriptional regulator n=1 Tax=Ilyomonas limi TaxID=2575867 RepID=A0A4U3L2Y9_9BACT|nr:Crp/Fnr family transcriptional regulator [Ilyomonas limi]TKK69408.1 Crp/Fnr family transcriptional regulator [Ilyomonas limi]
MNKTKTSCDVQSCFMCQGCMPDWLQLMAIHKKNLHFRKGELIFKEGQPIEGIYFLYKGKVKVHKHWGQEKELIIRFATNGDIVGHRGFGSNATYPVSATALEPTIICFVETDFFLSTLNINPQLTFKLMLFYASELQAAEHRMSNLVHMDMKGRIADSLLMLKNQFGLDEDGNINIIISRQDLASFAGASYESIFRIMNELVNDKIIAVQEKNIKILNELQLQAYTAAAV